MPRIDCEGLTKRFGKGTAVDHISFVIDDGAFCTLLGPSGCGKTTTLRMIAGLERPDGGAIRFGSQVVSSGSGGILTPPERRQIGLVFQSYALWPHMTVFDHVAFPLHAHHLTGNDVGERVQRALSLVQLEGLGHRLPSELSGGQQQRVALARAIVFEPSILLLDEPLSNLDTELRKGMRIELRRLHERLGVTTVYVTHDQLEALAMSDVIVVMDRGHIIEMDTPVAIYERPRTAHCARFVGGANLLTAQVVSSSQSTLELNAGLERTMLVYGAPQSLAPGDEVMVAIKPADIVVRSPFETGQNHYEGKVEAATYLGSHTDVQLRVGDFSMTARVPKLHLIDHSQGVTVELRPDALHVVNPAGVPIPDPSRPAASQAGPDDVAAAGTPTDSNSRVSEPSRGRV